MKIPAIQRVLLTGYLLFFLNFGPSFHRAPVFGLHDHSHDQTTCSCGRNHSFETPSEEHNANIEKQLCDCQLCKYFQTIDACNIECSHLHEIQLIYVTNGFLTPVQLTAIVAHPARGPPGI